MLAAHAAVCEAEQLPVDDRHERFRAFLRAEPAPIEYVRCRGAGLVPLPSRRATALVYRFADFTLDPGTRQLLWNGAEVHLAPKAFDLLVMLAANRARAVSKEELQQRLWPSTFVEETNLATLIAEIRRTLRDSAASPRFVRTI